MSASLSGIYAAAVTPFDGAGRPSYEQFQHLLNFFATSGCHGVFVAGTTGEGPSLSVAERIGLFAAAASAGTNLRVLAGTGAASLEDVKTLSSAAFDHGAEAITIIPPFFYLNPPLEGVISFYEAVLRAIPQDGAVLLYHNPAVSAPPVSHDLIARLRDKFPHQVRGIKDSSGDWSYTSALLEKFVDFQVFVGNDRFLAQALQAGASGAITALANTFPTLLRDVYDLHSNQVDMSAAQNRLSKALEQFDGVPRIAATKWVLKMANLIQNDAVRPPMRPLSDAELAILDERFSVHVEPADLSVLIDPPSLD